MRNDQLKDSSKIERINVPKRLKRTDELYRKKRINRSKAEQEELIVLLENEYKTYIDISQSKIDADEDLIINEIQFSPVELHRMLEAESADLCYRKDELIKYY